MVFPSKKIAMLTRDGDAEDGFSPPDFRPRRGLAGGHRQTLASPFFPRFLRLPGDEEQLFEVEDGTRVLSQRGLQTGIGMSTSGGSRGAPVKDAAALSSGRAIRRGVA